MPVAGCFLSSLRPAMAAAGPAMALAPPTLLMGLVRLRPQGSGTGSNRGGTSKQQQQLKISR